MRRLLMAIPLSMVSLCQFSAYGADGQVNFTGEIIATACEIKPSTKNQSVSLGKVSATSFPAKNSTSSDTPFYIELTKCPENSNVSIKFHGTGDTENEHLLANRSGSDYAKGIAVGLFGNDVNIPIKLNTEQGIQFPKTVSNQTKLRFIAKYVATKSAVTPGKVAATANFTLVYN